MRYTKTYPDGTVTLDGSQFHVNQEVIDSNIRNSAPIKVAVERLSELEDRNEPKILKHGEPSHVKAFDGEDRIYTYECYPCPTCGKWIVSNPSNKYCCKCGQALDWSGVE